MRERPKDVVKHACSVPDLFARAFERAASELTGADLAVLRAARAHDVRDLRWVPDATIERLVDHLALLRLREPSARYRFKGPDRAGLREVVGGALDARGCFVLAAALDEAFDSYHVDQPPMAHERVMPSCVGVFEDVDNPAPALGQMTPLAICRAWMHRFHYVGRLDALELFGRVPRWTRAFVGARASLPLKAARARRRLRVAVVGTPYVPTPALDRPAPGLFVVQRSWAERLDSDFERWLDVVSDQQAELCVLPECAITEDELGHLCELLRRRDRRFPSLLVVGLVHVPRNGAHVNEAVLVSARGEELLRHEKLEPFSLEAGEMEDILPRQSESYRVLDTPIGRLAVNICRDVRSDVPGLLNRALGVNLLCVPAWSKRLDFAADEARALGARQHAVTVVANAWGPASPEQGFVYAPFRSSAALHSLSSVSGKSASAVLHAVDVLVDAGKLGIRAHPVAFV